MLVTERTSGPGGAAALAEGIVYLGGGTPIQTACGFEDSLDDMYRYMMAACGPDPDEAKIARYCAESLGHFDWLVARGVPFDPTFCADTSMAPDRDRGAGLLGWRGRLPLQPDRPAGAPRPPGQDEALDRVAAHAAPGGGRGRRRCGRLHRHPGGPARGRHDGRVVGVQAQRFGETVSLRARRGVVLTAGGFIFNDDMLRQHCPPLVRGSFKVGTEGDDGRGIRMAQAIGASVRNMYAGEVSLPITPPRTLIHGILVNGQGQRFINEDTYMGRVGQSALYEQDGEVYLIVDEASYEVNWMGLAATWVCETAEQLETEIGLPAGSLQATSSSTTVTPQQGEDPLFHKGPAWVRPLVPPIGAFDLRIGPAPYAPFTLGGLETTVDGAVLDLNGEPIPGLFAAGRTTSGVCAFGYASGLSIGDSTMFGRFAGPSAAASPMVGWVTAEGGVLDDPRHHGVVGLVHGAAVDGRLRVVLDHQLCRLGGRAVDEQFGQPQRHVDPARDAGRGDDAPVEVLDDTRRAWARRRARRAAGSRTSGWWPSGPSAGRRRRGRASPCRPRW